MSATFGFGESASVATIDSSDLVEYESQPAPVKELIDKALALTKKKLSYTYGSNSPANRGMDCSGTVQHTLSLMAEGKVPRSSYGMYHWVKDSGNLVETPGVTETTDSVFADLKPGDLLFWVGTDVTKGRVPPISHVMVYLGTLKKDGKGVVFGASSGRRYRGKRIHGVSVFDWKVPSKSSKAKFVGYGPVPGLIKEGEVAAAPAETAPEKKKGLKSALEFLFKNPDNSVQ
ncbi:MAG: NlpC/P60 family protein [Verrucomicrobiales bacterium]|nr:NlpC/P60 family protein [Verrucomicrobiales bacterium]